MAVHYSRRAASAWITLARPDALNALDVAMLDALAQALARADADPQVRAVVLTGSGRAFCSGGDIAQLRADLDAGAPERADGYIAAVERGFAAARALAKPLIGCVNGVAVAGGLELLLCCDLVVAARGVRIGDGHANFAIFPGGGSSALLPRVLPLNLAKQLLFSGELWPAERWHALGLVNYLADADALEARAQQIADALAAKSPLLLARLKRSANQTQDVALAEALRAEIAELHGQMRSSDMREGTTAFLEKRTPVYTGT